MRALELRGRIKADQARCNLQGRELVVQIQRAHSGHQLAIILASIALLRFLCRYASNDRTRVAASTEGKTFKLI